MRYRNALIFAVIFTVSMALIKGCADRVVPTVPPAKQIIYVPTPDTMSVKEVILLKEQLRRTQDSLNLLKTDTTMSTELFVAKYKLERIRYYNDIAKKGNNIKYLRGWINRVLSE